MGNQETSPQEGGLKQVTFLLPKDLHRRFRVALMNEETTMQGMLESVVERYVAREEARTNAS